VDEQTGEEEEEERERADVKTSARVEKYAHKGKLFGAGRKQCLVLNTHRLQLGCLQIVLLLTSMSPLRPGCVSRRRQ